MTVIGSSQVPRRLLWHLERQHSLSPSKCSGRIVWDRCQSEFAIGFWSSWIGCERLEKHGFLDRRIAGQTCKLKECLISLIPSGVLELRKFQCCCDRLGISIKSNQSLEDVEFLRDRPIFCRDRLKDSQIALVPCSGSTLGCMRDLCRIESDQFGIFRESQTFVDWIFPLGRSSTPDPLTPVNNAILRDNVWHQDAINFFGI